MTTDPAGFVVVCIEAPSPAAVRLVEIAVCPSEAAARRAARLFSATDECAYYVLPWDRRAPGGDRAAFVLHLDRLLAEYGVQVEAVHGP